MIRPKPWQLRDERNSRTGSLQALLTSSFSVQSKSSYTRKLFAKSWLKWAFERTPMWSLVIYLFLFILSSNWRQRQTLSAYTKETMWQRVQPFTNQQHVRNKGTALYGKIKSRLIVKRLLILKHRMKNHPQFPQLSPSVYHHSHKKLNIANKVKLLRVSV